MAAVLFVAASACVEPQATTPVPEEPAADVVGWPCFNPLLDGIASEYAPTFFQVSEGIGDRITNFAYDHDWVAGNNWDNLNYYPTPAIVYYTVVETYNHYFITYPVFHPRDWCEQSFWFLCGGPFSGFDGYHENDLEGVRIVVDKNETTALFPNGKVIYAEALFHLGVLRYSNALNSPNGMCGAPAETRHPGTLSNVGGNSVRPACLAWDPSGQDRPRPAFVIQSRGHGIASANDTELIGYWPLDHTFPGYIYEWAGYSDDPGVSPWLERYSYALYWLGSSEYVYPYGHGLWGRRLFDSDTYRWVGQYNPGGSLPTDPLVEPYDLKWGRQFWCSGSGQCTTIGARAEPPWAWSGANAISGLSYGMWFTHPAWAMKKTVSAPGMSSYQTSNPLNHSYYVENLYLDEQDAPDSPQYCGGGGLFSLVGSASQATRRYLSVGDRPRPARFVREREWSGHDLSAWGGPGVSLSSVSDNVRGGREGRSVVTTIEPGHDATLELQELVSADEFLEVVVRFRGTARPPQLEWEAESQQQHAVGFETVYVDKEGWVVATAELWRSIDWTTSVDARNPRIRFGPDPGERVQVSRIVFGH